MKLKPLVQMMAIIPAMLMPAATALHASDLGIYKGNTVGKTSILLMLDTSGSMGISSLVLPKNNQYGSPGDVDSSLCDRVDVSEYYSGRSSSARIYEWAYNLKDSVTKNTAIRKSVTIDNTEIPYYVRGCSKNGVTQYDRLSRLKDAIIPLLASNEISNDVMMGLGQFSSKTELTIGTASNRLTDGHSGRILVPNAALTLAQRKKIALEIAAIKSLDTTTNEDGTKNDNLKLSSDSYPNVTKASSGTPTAHAYAEAGAYMMGTGTGSGETNSGQVSIIYDGYMVKQQGDNDGQVYFICTELGSGTTSALGATVRQCPSAWPGYDSNNKTASGTTIRKPNGSGDWDIVSSNDFKTYVANHPELGGTNGQMNRLWDVYKNLPIGWRFDGWMRVDNEPMDIEPIVGTVWGYGDGIRGLVSYRTNPFAIKMGQTGTKKGFLDCPAGYQIDSGWISLCYRDDGPWFKNATSSGGKNPTYSCPTPVKGEEPILTYNRNSDGTTYYDHANKNYTSVSGNQCKQTRWYVARPWGDVPVIGLVENTIGGFAYSAADTKKDNSVYKAGGSTSSCDGNGIYFLTDGAPNSTKDSMAQIIMNTSLSNNNKYTFSVKPSGTGVLISPALQSGLFENETGGWEYIGEYAKKLLDPAMNPGNMKIKTAVVGFGASFEGILKNADGSYNCESVKDSNPDAYNACQWGGSEFGNGGFYYANNPDDIKNSIINFVNNVTVSFTPSSLGSISVPRDPLDQTRVMTTGFFPMVMPMEDTSIRNWVGNLKKYKILGGTLKDNSNNAIYTTQNGQQVINSSAKDLWSNAATGADNSLINSGGAWNQIPVPSTLNITGEPSNASSQRRVFTIDGSSLRQITKENLATDYSGTTPVALNNVSINQRYALLNYLGYQTTFPPATDATLTSTQIATMAVIPTNPYRYLGGVVHSTPLVVTKSATLSSGANSVTSRSEYVVYGSMDGGLHVVDASTGEEKSVFVPKEILDHQYDTLSGQNSKGLSGLTGMVYGVDAPWAADNTFKVVSTSSGKTTTTKYEANRMNIYGGLRMGGKAIYGLDIGTPSTPKLKFHITPSTSGFDRMAQIWSKPTLAQIRIQGKTKRVLIFGGGYDPDTYEIAGLTTEPSSSKGNALYIVDADNGDLIWQTSENVSASNTASPNSDIKYSVVAQPVAMDYDADGLADMIYFADLGGQIFRIDLNNATQISTTVTTNPAVRVRRIANLREGSGSNLFVPRFYDRLTTAVFNGDNGRFVLVTAGSGNRSFPLESSKGQNKIYGIFDFDAASNGLEKTNYANYDVEATSSNVVNRGDLGKTATTISWGGGNIKNDQIRSNLSKGGIYRGWSFNLKSVSDSTSNYYSKSFEESQLVSSDLYVNLYDPKATLSGVVNACGGGIQGISTTHRICAPYGDCAAYVKQSYQGIIGPSLGAVSDSSDRTSSLVGPVGATQEACIGKCSSNNSSLTDQTLGQYSQSRKIKPTRWFEW